MAQMDNNYPPRWDAIDHFIHERWMRAESVAAEMGFQDIGSLRRFGARYRLARSFGGVNLHGYGDDTERGYSALMRVFLVWTAFEYLCKKGGRSARELIDPHDTETPSRHIREVDPDYRFYRFIRDHVDGRHQKQLDRFVEAAPGQCHIKFLASAIRHVFAHGILTPSVGDGRPDAVLRICQVLSEFFLGVMADDFVGRVEGVERGFRQLPF